MIYHLVHFGLSGREIARRLDRSPSTVSRELRRNARCEEDYWYEYAQRDSSANASVPRSAGKSNLYCPKVGWLSLRCFYCLRLVCCHRARRWKSNVYESASIGVNFPPLPIL